MVIVKKISPDGGGQGGVYGSTRNYFASVNIILIVISVVLYYPFFKMYDKELLEEEKAKEAIEG